MVKSIVVISGKGGVGKSLVTATLVNILREKKLRVAAIDADTDNPHLADFLGVDGQITVTTRDNERRLVPAEMEGGLKVFSTSLLAADSPIGLLGSTSGELVNDVIQFGEWGEMDFFCIDLPAGAGDEMRAAFRSVEKTLVGCIVVAQPAHLKAAERVLKLLILNEIPILGIIENMAYYPVKTLQMNKTNKPRGEVLKEVQRKDYLFGQPGALQLAQKYGVDFLGEIPIVPVSGDGKKTIPPPFSDPVVNGAKKAMVAPVKTPGFLARAKEKVKEITAQTIGPMLVDLWAYANKELPIGELQSQYGYTSHRLIRLHLLDNHGNIITTEHFRVLDGKLEWQQLPDPGKDPEKFKEMNDEIDTSGVRLYAKTRALAEAFTGKRKLQDGTEIEYTMKTAILNGDIVPVGKPGDMIQTIGFLQGMYEYIQKQKPPFIIEFAKRVL